MNRQPLPFSLAAPWASWLQLRDAALRLVLAAFIGTLAFALAPHGSASAADPVVTSFELAAPERLTVGGRVRFLIRVEADQDTTLSLAPGGLPSVLSLTGALQTAAREANAGRVEITLQFEAAPFAVGELELPPIRLRYRSADGVTGEIVTPASRLIVESVLPDTDVLAPRDLKAQAAIGDRRDASAPAARPRPGPAHRCRPYRLAPQTNVVARDRRARGRARGAKP